VQGTASFYRTPAACGDSWGNLYRGLRASRLPPATFPAPPAVPTLEKRLDVAGCVVLPDSCIIAESMRILGLILIALLTQQRPGPATASIRGVVVKLGTSDPVAKAVVQLVKAGDDSVEPQAVATGTDGRFQFRNLAAGSYQLLATRSGYLDTAYGQRGPSGSGRNLVIASGATIDDIRLQMTATGAISGRVFDDTGEPLANVPIQALKDSYDEGQRTLTEIKGDETNDLGEFRIFWLPPGQYIIRAQPQGSDAANKIFVMHGEGGKSISFGEIRRDSPADKLGEAYVPVYYPGTTEPQSATRVEVRPGADIRGVDFSLLRVSTRKVRGTVIDSTTGLPASQGSVQLIPRGDGGASHTPAASPGDRGMFEISGVLPGSYFLVATARLGTPNDVRVMLGRIPIEVRNTNLNDLVVTLRPTVDLSGTVVVEGRAEGLPDDAHPVVTLQSGRPGIFGGLGQVHGSFTRRTEVDFSGVPEGEYRVVWSNLPPDMYVKSMRFGPVDALGGTLAIDSRTQDRFQIVFGTNVGTLEGVVLDKLRNAVAGARVALVPDVARRQRADLYQSTSSDDSGRFQFRGVAPGDYSLFAWEDIENGLWQDPEFIRRHETSGKPVRILENGRETVETVAIPFAF
jgi:hypothetical protein